MHLQTILLLASAVAALVTCPGVVAQSVPSQPKPRAEATEERPADVVARWPALGEGYEPEPPFKSTKTRAQRKEETLAACENRELQPTGQQNDRHIDRDASIPAAARTRADQKAETRAAIAMNRLMPAGERSQDNARP
jgi:hypothetical protein